MELLMEDKQIIEINKIKDITSIHVTDFIVSNRPILGLMVFYGNNKSMYLTEIEKNFTYLVKKVREVYTDEKNNIYDDGFGNGRSISIDSRSTQILESGLLEQVKPLYEFYKDKESYNNTLFFQVDEINSLKEIILYHIRRILSTTDCKFYIGNELSGYRDVYKIDAKIDGRERQLFLYYEKEDDNNYKATITGLFAFPMEMKISFKNNSISVRVVFDNIYYEFDYKILESIVKKEEKGYKGPIEFFYKNENLEKTDNPYLNLTTLDYDKEFEWFKLPWDAYYGINVLEKNITSNGKLLDNHNMYLQVNSEGFERRENYSSHYILKNNEKVTSMELESHMTKMNGIYIDNNYGVIETKFLETARAKGFYLDYLNNKYFYHVVKLNNGFEKVSGYDLVPVTQNDVQVNTDLLNSNKIYKIMGVK